MNYGVYQNVRLSNGNSKVWHERNAVNVTDLGRTGTGQGVAGN